MARAKAPRNLPWDMLGRWADRLGDADAARHARAFETGQPDAASGLGRVLHSLFRLATGPAVAESAATAKGAAAAPPLSGFSCLDSVQIMVAREAAGHRLGADACREGRPQRRTPQSPRRRFRRRRPRRRSPPGRRRPAHLHCRNVRPQPLLDPRHAKLLAQCSLLLSAWSRGPGGGIERQRPAAPHRHGGPDSCWARGRRTASVLPRTGSVRPSWTGGDRARSIVGDRWCPRRAARGGNARRRHPLPSWPEP